MRRLAFPFIIVAIIIAGLALGNSSKAARSGISEEALVRSGHTADPTCGAVAPGPAAAEGEPMQLATVVHCAENSNGGCLNEGAVCGQAGKKKKNPRIGVCTTVITKQKRARCECVN